ncbi:2OG-Fe(II) oxygenase [Methylomonas fluvii]|uniref:2OG-Fe(II) oxygenase n=1 Tax=Methylomonas fluvii TaxID=1854564 RepID=A0ABR9DH65_9GAMM|nr:2OG-Fe(II) oxygenase [Methylomonas fluvii]MBD9362442.1 2OG-Fe(II) oxygenase [Methylomonas fluvii]CAD6875543.1 hypothetical protein [Methylomonas fluvii]
MTETDIDIALFSSEAHRLFLVQLKAKAVTQPGNAALAWRIAQIHRALGEFDDALHYYCAVQQAEPGHPEASYFIDLLSGKGGNTPLNTCGSLAPPFIRFENFLDARMQEALWQATTEQLPELHPSVVEEYGVVGLHQNTRRSHSNRAGQRIRDIFYQRVAELVERHDIIGKLEISNLDAVRDLQISLIAYGDGDYFKAHRDSGTMPNNRLRELSFVYHFFREPKRFSGGALYLYDAGQVAGEIAQVNNFTCLHPVNNSITFFPSRALHEVTPIECASKNPIDGRFAITGWALRPEDNH